MKIHIYLYYNDIYGHALTSEPLPRGHEIYNFGRPFLGHHYYIISLSDLCLGAEKKIFKEIMHFHYMTYKATPSIRTPAPGVMKFTIFGRPFLGHHYYTLSLSDLCLGFFSLYDLSGHTLAHKPLALG